MRLRHVVLVRISRIAGSSSAFSGCGVVWKLLLDVGGAGLEQQRATSAVLVQRDWTK